MRCPTTAGAVPAGRSGPADPRPGRCRGRGARGAQPAPIGGRGGGGGAGPCRAGSRAEGAGPAPAAGGGPRFKVRTFCGRCRAAQPRRRVAPVPPQQPPLPPPPPGGPYNPRQCPETVRPPRGRPGRTGPRSSPAAARGAPRPAGRC